jgi:hypothetical protein
MRSGVGHIVFGAVLLAAGLAVTLLSEQVFWWGAIAVGIFELVRGIVMALRSRG